jgi:hypothetical protein
MEQNSKKKGEVFSIIHNTSALTHAHKRSQMACGIYISIAARLIGDMSLNTAVRFGLNDAMEYYKTNPGFAAELQHFKRLEEKGFDNIPEKEIKSSGYVVDTLEAAVWCLLKTKNYRDCVLKAVNLGEDTDTVAAVAGGLAGLHYGYDNIPKEWVAVITKRDYIESLCIKLDSALMRKGIEKLCSYIPYFETANKDSVCKWCGGEKLEENHFAMAYPEYDQTLREFIHDVYETNLISFDYLEVIHERGVIGRDQMINAIDAADFDLLKALLTGYVRQERFCDGLWASAVEDKVFLKILKRLRHLSAFKTYAKIEV